MGRRRRFGFFGPRKALSESKVFHHKPLAIVASIAVGAATGGIGAILMGESIVVGAVAGGATSGLTAAAQPRPTVIVQHNSQHYDEIQTLFEKDSDKQKDSKTKKLSQIPIEIETKTVETISDEELVRAETNPIGKTLDQNSSTQGCVLDLQLKSKAQPETATATTTTTTKTTDAIALPSASTPTQTTTLTPVIKNPDKIMIGFRIGENTSVLVKSSDLVDGGSALVVSECRPVEKGTLFPEKEFYSEVRGGDCFATKSTVTGILDTETPKVCTSTEFHASHNCAAFSGAVATTAVLATKALPLVIRVPLLLLLPTETLTRQ